VQIFFNVKKIYQYLLICLAFLMPITVSIANLVIVIIVLLWLLSGDYKKKYHEITKSKIILSSIIFYFVHVIGMLWTDDVAWGFHILHKMWYFILLLPILHSIVRKEYIQYYMYAFLLAILITEVISYLVWFEYIGEFMKASSDNPTPFMSHVSFNPFLAFAIYLVLHEIMFNKKIKGLILFLYSSFSLVMTVNMFITGGRAGQAMFFLVVILLVFQFFRGQKIKAFFTSTLLVCGIFFTAYQTSPLFKERFDLAIDEVINYEVKSVAINQSVDSSVGARILFANNSIEIIKNNPILGVGTGDFPSVYKATSLKNSPHGPYATNPHNMYLLILVQLGLIGLVSMLSIIFYQIKFSFSQTEMFSRNVGFALPCLFLLIMLSDAYLLGHFTGLLFIFFSSFLYKDFESH
jgi:O-antigen ligase